MSGKFNPISQLLAQFVWNS